jgi:hypothetical protein
MMLANDAPAIVQPERLTWSEICQRYPDEWVVLVETEWLNDTDFEFGTALVLAHHRTRKAVSPSVKAAFQHHAEVGKFWTGEIIAPARTFVVP